jgi:hypothetical protein
MSLRDLPTQTMISLSAAWLDPAHARSAIEGLPTAAAVLPKLSTAHRTLLKTQPAGAAKTPKQIADIQAQQAQLDLVHDRKARGLYGILGGLADVLDDQELCAKLLELRDKIFPADKGLNVTKMSYADEAGECALVEERLDDADRALLKACTILKGNLLDVHKARVTAGKKLGDLEQKRLAAETDGAGDSKQRPKKGDALQARNGWIKATRALVSAIELDEPSDEVRKRILQPLDQAEAKAARQRAAGAPEPAAGDAAGPAGGHQTAADKPGGAGTDAAETGA